MAVPRRQDPELEDLIRRGVEEILRLNPRLADPPQPFTEDEIAEILRGDEALDALWNSPEGRRAQALGISAADAVSEDRGE